ncbi:glycosyltransferase family 2 protein, partial [Campylobacter coli]|nr:glycosyltransferase family 2 protein [Campylobacter coli]EAJ5266813.1 glycosyltransferase family 2 protein [Campylobacter coli]EAK4000789.1 glycosyltransferase family 2 protein [Campylobacter coli]
MKTVGVVIPIYNVEKYLKECLDSVINQTYTNLEIILVNDGSTDENSLNIAKEYTLKDKRITLFDKKNGGLSSARNVGIEYFSGEYKLKNKTQIIKENSLIEFNIEGNNPYEIYTIYKSYKAFNDEQDLTSFTYPIIDYIIFLDSDDYWELNCIEECVPRMDGVEVVWMNHVFLYEYYDPNAFRVTLIDKLKFTSSNKYSIDFLISKMQNLNQNSFWFGWHGMINFKYLYSIKLKFIDRLLHEDHYFGKLLFFQAKQIYIYTKKKIHYRIRKGSIMNYSKENSYIPSYALSEYSALNNDYFLYKKYHRISSLFLTAMMVFKFMKEDNKIKSIESFKQIFYKKLKSWRNDLVDFDEFFLEKVLFLSFQEFFRLSSDYRVNLE